MSNGLDEQMINKLRKELLWTRIIGIVSSVLMICVLIGGIWAFNKALAYEKQLKDYAVQVEQYAAEIKPIMEKLSNLDVKALNDALVQTQTVIEAVDWAMLNDSVASVDWENVSNQLSSLDVEAINKAIDGLDTRELTKSLETLNGIVDTMRGIADKISSFTEKLGW